MIYTTYAKYEALQNELQTLPNDEADYIPTLDEINDLTKQIPEAEVIRYLMYVAETCSYEDLDADGIKALQDVNDYIEEHLTLTD